MDEVVFDVWETLALALCNAMPLPLPFAMIGRSVDFDGNWK